MKFLDQAKIFIKSGNGGAGCISFRREKNIAFGGPNGGDGGSGGHVYVECVPSLNTLIDYRYRQHFKAGTGIHGSGRNRAGKAGDDIVLTVPVGTQIFDEDSDLLLADMTEIGETIMLAKGGNGGWGNARFKSSTNQAPRNANPGEDGEERWLWLRLKLIADVGLVGLPNAGKSTFLSAVTAATPKMADYPFTTIRPHLGVVELGITERFVMADLPGLIEGAADGAGLGHRFLGHVERCAAIVHIIDGTQDDPGDVYSKIRNELGEYSELILDKPEIVVLNKCDAITDEQQAERLALLEAACGKTPLTMSGVSGEGTKPVLSAVFQHVKIRREREEAERLEREAQKERDKGFAEAEIDGKWRP